MSDEKQAFLANKVYNLLCEVITNNGWVFEKEDESLRVRFTVNGDDIPMRFIIAVDADRQLIRVLSPFPFCFSKEKILDGAIATCVANYALVDGSFDYNISEGSIFYRMTASFRESLIGEGLLKYMIAISCAVVDKYNDKFLAINKGMLSINDFISGD